MRLIDADKYLEKVCTYKETGCGSCKLQTTCPKDTPTVNAIPIEWVKNGSIKVVDDYYYGYAYNSCIKEIEEVSKWCIIIGSILFFISLCL